MRAALACRTAWRRLLIQAARDAHAASVAGDSSSKSVKRRLHRNVALLAHDANSSTFALISASSGLRRFMMIQSLSRRSCASRSSSRPVFWKLTSLSAKLSTSFAM
eukprot:scaffold273_cov242-Pinguiococcus_pyrenoidosus.AAC.25